MTESQRVILGKLAEVVLPLASWVAQKTYNPESRGEAAPWRHGEPLTAEKLGAPEFLDALLRETASDAILAARWREISADPLKYFPGPEAQGWRSLRGLQPQGKFGLAESSNAPFNRGALYAAALPLLEQAVAAAGNAPDYVALVDEFYNDKPGHWPAATVAASVFIKQFTCDLLYAVLGMRNSARAPWQTAVLSELGEHRRVGNEYSPGMVREARETLKKMLG